MRGTSYVKLSRLRRLENHINEDSQETCTCFAFEQGGILARVRRGELTTVERFARFNDNFHVTVHSLRLQNTNGVVNTRRRKRVRSINCSVCLGLLSRTMDRRGNRRGIAGSLSYLVSVSISTRVPRDCIRDLALHLSICHEVTSVHDGRSTSSIVSRLRSEFNGVPGSILKLVSVTLIHGGTCSVNVCRVERGNAALVLFMGRLGSPRITSLLVTLNKGTGLITKTGPYITIRYGGDSTPLRVLAGVFNIRWFGNVGPWFIGRGPPRAAGVLFFNKGSRRGFVGV